MSTLDVELRMIIDYALSIDKREMNESELCSEIERLRSVELEKG